MQKRVQIKMMTESLALLKEAQRLIQEGESETASSLFSDEISKLKKIQEKLGSSEYKEEMASQIDALTRMERKTTIYEDDHIALVPIKTKDLADQYLEVRIENDFFPSVIREERARQHEIDEVFDDRTFYCGIISKDSDTFTGYCGINNIYAEQKELAIAILKRFQHNGYGFRSMNAFMRTMQEEVGISHFIAKVDPENKESRQLMIKLGFKPSGIDTFLIDDEDKLRELEEENLSYITDDLINLAKEFNVEPRSLLSHILVYSIDL